MLTNLDWLAEGLPFPPPQETDRLNTYRTNDLLFQTKHKEAWNGHFGRLALEARKRDRDIGAIFNYHQLLSKKTADFVCGEPPTLETEGDTDGLSRQLRKQGFSAKLYEAFIDVSRYGNGIPKVVEKSLTIVSPQCWFPVVDPADLKEITHHVVAYPTDPSPEGVMRQLYVEIHERGKVEIRWYNLNGSPGSYLIGPLSTEPEPRQLPFDDFAVQPLTNVTHSGSLYGLDDYAIVNSIVERIMWRLHCADTVLDKHSEPSMMGPESALRRDERSGLWLVESGNYFIRNSQDDSPVSYVTWEGNLDANFKEIDLLFEQLYILTEMGAAFLEGGQSGAASSGTALKLRMVSPRIKARRLVGLNDDRVRRLILLLAQVGGVKIDPDDLTLTWNDGLPDDEVEDASRRNVETAGRATKSQYSAIKERGLSDEETEAELEQIYLEAARSSPNVLAVDPTNKDDSEYLEEVEDGN